MYFTKIRLHGLTTIDLPIVNARPSDVYILKDASGLGPTEVDVSIISTLNAGGYYQGRRAQLREIVIHVGLNPSYQAKQSVSDLRQYLYGMMTPGLSDKVKVELLDGATSVAYVTGYVKKLEVVPFSKTPEAQLTIACEQKYLQAPMPKYVSELDKQFPKIINEGTAPAGYHMEVVMTAPHDWWTISKDEGITRFRVDYPFMAGDTLIMDTQPGFRAIELIRGGSTTNIIYGLTPDSTWYLLHGGENSFGTTYQDFNWQSVYYTPQYWGI